MNRVHEVYFNGGSVVYPEIINPQMIRAFDRINDTDRRAVFILHLALFDHKEISDVMRVSERTIRRWIEHCYKKYPQYKRVKPSKLST